MCPPEIDNVTANADTVVDTTLPPAPDIVVGEKESVVPPEVKEPEKERTTQDALDEVIAKVKARKEKEEAGTEGKDKKTPTGKTEEVVDEKIAAAAAAAAKEFKPDFKFKFMGVDGKQIEKEIPKEIQSLIKDEATEKAIKQLYSKAEGLEGVIAHRAEVQKERDAFRGEAQGLKDGINSLRADYQRGDLDSFFNKLKIPIERVMQYALEKAQYLELPADQRAKIDAQRASERKTFELQNQNTGMNTALQQEMAKARSYMLEATLMKPDVTTVAASFDAQFGKPGLFKQTVINHGKNVWNDSGGKVDLSPEQAVQQVMEMYGLKAGVALPAKVEGTTTTTEKPTANTVLKVDKPTTTIPNIRGSQGASPLPAKAKSTEDLKKIYKEKFG